MADVTKDGFNHLARFELSETHEASYHSMLTTASKRPTTRPNLGSTTGATPPEELEDVDEEVNKPLAVESLVEDVECLILDGLDDSSRVEGIEEPDPEPEGVELTLTVPPVNPEPDEVALPPTIPLVNPVVANPLVDIGTGLGTAIVVATENE